MRQGGMDSGRPEPSGRSVWIILLLVSAVSWGMVLWFGREIGFTADEMTLISRASSLGPGDLLDPYVGHLVAVPLIAYKLLIETVGTGSYLPFQLLTFSAITLLAAGMLVWAGRRLPASIALVPAVLLVFFPADVLHFIAGNGFTVVLPLALGVWALVLWDAETRLGDLGAALLIATAIATYTVGVAFAVGLVAAALMSRRDRIWVGAVPLIAYAVWRLLVAEASPEPADVGPHWSNLLLLPAWIFQSTGAILVALSGLGFPFADGVGPGATSTARAMGAVFATGFTVWFVVETQRGSRSPVFWATCTTAVALFASQVLVWGSLDGRGEPGEERYLYPGAVVLLLIAVELARGIRWTGTAERVIWASTTVALISSAGFLINEFDRREAGTGVAKAQVTAIRILGSDEEAPGLERAKTVVVNDFDPEATARFRELGFDETRLRGERPLFTRTVDQFLATALDLELARLSPGERTRSCRPAASRGTEPEVAGPIQTHVPRGGVVLESPRDLELSLGRYDRRASWNLGTLWADQPARLDIPVDEGTKPWFLQANATSPGTLADLSICRPPRP